MAVFLSLLSLFRFWKSCVRLITDRGFESLSLRQKKGNPLGCLFYLGLIFVGDSMRHFKFLVIFLLFSFLFVSCSSKSNNIIASSESLFNNSKNYVAENELKVKNAFAQNSKFEDDAFRFRKYNFSEANNISTLFGFMYTPTRNSFTCSFSSTDYNYSEKPGNYGSVTFTWGKFKLGSFYGVHYFNDNDIIEFEYSGFQFANDNIDSRYKYTIIGNTYTKSLSQKDIDKYAYLCYKCIQNSITYDQSIIST